MRPRRQKTVCYSTDTNALDTNALVLMGQRIQDVRKGYGLSQEEIACRLRVSRRVFSNIENGVRAPSGILLLALEFVLNVNPDWIKDGIGEKFKDSTEAVTGSEAIDSVELLKGFNSLSCEGKDKLIRLMRVFVKLERKGTRSRILRHNPDN